MSENHEVLVTGIIGGITTLAGSILAWLGGRGKTKADVQTQIDNTVKFLLGELRTERERCEKELAETRGDLANCRQEVWSLENALRAHGIDLPKRPPPAAVVFVPKPEEKTNG